MATFDDAITVTATGTTQATAGTSASIALSTIPTAAGGTNTARYVRIAAINESYVKVGDSSVTATTNDVLVQPADAVILRVQGCTHVAFIQGASAGKVNIVPLEDQ